MAHEQKVWGERQDASCPAHRLGEQQRGSPARSLADMQPCLGRLAAAVVAQHAQAACSKYRIAGWRWRHPAFQ